MELDSQNLPYWGLKLIFIETKSECYSFVFLRIHSQVSPRSHESCYVFSPEKQLPLICPSLFLKYNMGRWIRALVKKLCGCLKIAFKPTFLQRQNVSRIQDRDTKDYYSSWLLQWFLCLKIHFRIDLTGNQDSKTVRLSPKTRRRLILQLTLALATEGSWQVIKLYKVEVTLNLIFSCDINCINYVIRMFFLKFVLYICYPFFFLSSFPSK